MTDPHASEQMLNEQYRTIDQLRRDLASERELADELHHCLQALMKDYIRQDLDPRTDEAISITLATYRERRTTWITE